MESHLLLLVVSMDARVREKEVVSIDAPMEMLLPHLPLLLLPMEMIMDLTTIKDNKHSVVVLLGTTTSTKSLTPLRLKQDRLIYINIIINNNNNNNNTSSKRQLLHRLHL